MTTGGGSEDDQSTGNDGGGEGPSQMPDGRLDASEAPSTPEGSEGPGSSDSSGSGGNSGSDGGSSGSDGGGSEPEGPSGNDPLVVTAEDAPDADNPIVEPRLNQAATALMEEYEMLDERSDFQLEVTDSGWVEFGGLTREGREDAIEQNYMDRGAESVSVELGTETSVSGAADGRLIADQSPSASTETTMDVDVEWPDPPDQVKTPDGEHVMTPGEDAGPAIGSEEFQEGFVEARQERGSNQDVSVEKQDDGSFAVTAEGRYGKQTVQNKAEAAAFDINGVGGRTDGETGNTQTEESNSESNYEGKDRSGFMLEVEKAADAAVDTAFQEETSESIARTLKFSKERVSDDTNITGPGIDPTAFLSENEGVFQSGGDGELNTDITDSLTNEGGFISEKREQELREEATRSQEFYGLGDEADDLVTGVTGSEKAGNVARGVGNIPGDVMAASEYATIGIETGVETAENFGETADEYGTRETGEAVIEGLAQTGDAAATYAKENPYQFAGEVGGEVVIGGAAFKGVERAGDLASSKRTAQKAETVVDIDEVSDPSTRGQTVGSGNPEFSREAVEDTDTAVQEFTEQAQKAPDEVKEATESEELIYHGTRADFPDSGDVTAGDRSEVAGQFFAADVSPLRLSDEGSSSILPRKLGDLKPRTPDIGDDRNVVATEPKRIEAVPDEVGGSRTPGDDLDKPVRETDRLGREQVTGREKGRVSEYMTEQGGDGEAFIMPRGTRTPEQEAVIPEGTTFQKTDTTIGLRLESGEVIPMRKYKYGDSDADADTRSTNSPESTSPDVEVSDLPTSRVSRNRSGSVFAGGSMTGVALGSISGGSRGDTSPGTTSTDFDMNAGPTSPGLGDGGSPTGQPTGPDVGGASIGPVDFGGPSGGTPSSSSTGGSSSPVGSPPSGGSGGGSGGSGGSGSGPVSPPSSPPSGGGSGGPSGGGPSGPPSGGSSSPPSGPPSGGTPFNPGYPGTPSQTPPSPPRIDITISDDSDSDDFESPFDGVKSQSFTDFVDPLTGEVLKTEADN